MNKSKVLLQLFTKMCQEDATCSASERTSCEISIFLLVSSKKRVNKPQVLEWKEMLNKPLANQGVSVVLPQSEINKR